MKEANSEIKVTHDKSSDSNMSIAEDVLESSEKSIFVLGYGNKTVSSTMFKDSLNSLKSFICSFFSY